MRLGLVVVCVLCVTACSGAKVYSIYETADKIEADGYHSETHHVTTSDGYILEMHRIPYKTSAAEVKQDRPVVFLMHGLMSASVSFVLLGPQLSFAYHLVDAGFDVWMGNARGNKNSRHHVALDPDDDLQKYAFFDFSFEEIGMRDLPAMIDYALEYTKQDQLHYIGHSQGGTVYLVFSSMLPEYNKKIKSTHLLAGVGYMEYFPHQELAQMASMSDMIYGLALQNGVVELYPPNSTDMFPADLFPIPGQRIADNCAGNLRLSHYCELIGVRHLLRNVAEPGIDDQPGAALKQIAHYGQNIRDKIFRRFHYGSLDNVDIYGSSTPPAYDLGLITTHVTMHYSLADELLDERDVLAMVADMPNAIARKVARDSFEHSDYVIALDAKELVTDYIIAAINNDGVPPPTQATPAPTEATPAPTPATSAPSTATTPSAVVVVDGTTEGATTNEAAQPTEADEAAPTQADEATTPPTGSAYTFSTISYSYLVVISLIFMLR
ncbi:unnamed protein product [Chrysodeixis includens]|uniref:Partial AB-hydrolase lipase domain-containing protein n=1 Tax=Chrysodeixis includens TaxID=689277 RepID=A0A9P0FW79_CHRIL|nr:unnamed protein product [Chrysodeixis includens]